MLFGGYPKGSPHDLNLITIPSLVRIIVFAVCPHFSLFPILLTLFISLLPFQILPQCFKIFNSTRNFPPHF